MALLCRRIIQTPLQILNSPFRKPENIMQGCMDADQCHFVPQDGFRRHQVLKNLSVLVNLSWGRVQGTSYGMPNLMLAIAISIAASNTSLAQDSRSKRLIQQPSDIEILLTRSKMEMELDGEVRVEDKTAKQTGGIRSVPLKAKATSDYFEAIGFSQGQQAAAARQYVTAQQTGFPASRSSVSALWIVAKHAFSNTKECGSNIARIYLWTVERSNCLGRRSIP